MLGRERHGLAAVMVLAAGEPGTVEASTDVLVARPSPPGESTKEPARRLCLPLLNQRCDRNRDEDAEQRGNAHQGQREGEQHN
jgi:hypothetical protein